MEKAKHYPIKYLFPIILLFFASVITRDLSYLLAGSAEIMLVFLFAETELVGSRIASNLANGILLLIYVQTIVLLFSGSYITVIMLTNLASLHMLRGKALVYGLTVLVGIAALAVPYSYNGNSSTNSGREKQLITCAVSIILIALTFNSSVIYNTGNLMNKLIQKKNIERSISEISEDNNLDFGSFYRDVVQGGLPKPASLPEKPNIVLIFTEGLSENIISDDREIMPNVRAFEEEGITFTNYYDHTAATYRGIIGQLYSSHQYNNGDRNGLISLQSLLSKAGYSTTFINSEPDNKDFTDYLNSFGFESVLSAGSGETSLTDKQVYEILYDKLSEGGATGKPQFISTYTFGTHVSFDSTEEVFGKGDNRLLNRFFDADYQFGGFLNRIKETGLYENTIVIFTADHASFVDDDYALTFPDYERKDSFCDIMPLIIGFNGVEHQEIDAQGRNSLDLAPTILDLLDMEKYPNYFLGTSLFNPDDTGLMETVFCVPDSDWIVSTAESHISALDDEVREDYTEQLQRYLALTQKTDMPIP